MKKVVNGKLYDTSEATAVCSWCKTGVLFGIEITVQFTLCREQVTKKPLEGLKLDTWGGVSGWDVKEDCSKGDFFLAAQVGGGCSGGRIHPLGVDEARRIFEEHTDADYNLEDVYERYFGVRPQKPLFEQFKEAFKAGAEAQRRQYKEEQAKKDSGEPF